MGKDCPDCDVMDIIYEKLTADNSELKKQNEALNLSIGMLNKRLMTAMELLRRWSKTMVISESQFEETDEFLKTQGTK